MQSERWSPFFSYLLLRRNTARQYIIILPRRQDAAPRARSERAYNSAGGHSAGRPCRRAAAPLGARVWRRAARRRCPLIPRHCAVRGCGGLLERCGPGYVAATGPAWRARACSHGAQGAGPGAGARAQARGLRKHALPPRADDAPWSGWGKLRNQPPGLCRERPARRRQSAFAVGLLAGTCSPRNALLSSPTLQ